MQPPRSRGSLGRPTVVNFVKNGITDRSVDLKEPTATIEVKIEEEQEEQESGKINSAPEIVNLPQLVTILVFINQEAHEGLLKMKDHHKGVDEAIHHMSNLKIHVQRLLVTHQSKTWFQRDKILLLSLVDWLKSSNIVIDLNTIILKSKHVSISADYNFLQRYFGCSKQMLDVDSLMPPFFWFISGWRYEVSGEIEDVREDIFRPIKLKTAWSATHELLLSVIVLIVGFTYWDTQFALLLTTVTVRFVLKLSNILKQYRRKHHQLTKQKKMTEVTVVSSNDSKDTLMNNNNPK